MTTIALLRLFIVYNILECVTSEICRFPEFLQSGRKDGKLQPWVTRSWWINIRDNPKMREQREVYVKDSYMWIIHKEDKIKCDRKSRMLTDPWKTVMQEDCSTRKEIHNRTCLVREMHNKYRIAQFSDDGRSVAYVCMSFTLRSHNVVQVTQGPMRSQNTPDLCADREMYIDDWPWIASWKPDASACPVAGGFTFRTVSRLTNQDVCENDWRRSKLEIECLKGDGMDFFAPKGSNCNPFLSHGEWKRLHCWGGWTHGNYSFMIASGEEHDPHFCMRFPVRTGKEFVALLYFSPICPVAEDGQPPTGIDYYELHLKRTVYDECEDENVEVCQNHALKGMCEKTDSIYRPHCRRTCGLCGDKSEQVWSMKCPFSELVRGNWLLLENNIEEKIAINQTHVYFSNLGYFVCQERAPDDFLYKLVSNFNNGCSTRYTCIELKRPHNNILQFRLGRSYREDKNHAEMCNFKKDTYLDPISDLFRSSWKKNLIRDGILWESPCGLSGVVPFNATIEGHKCAGSFSDWNPFSCTYSTHITITANNCYGMKAESQYQCIAFLEDEFELSDKMPSKMILTKAMDGSNEFVCWVMTTFMSDDFSWPMTRIYKMPNLQCSSFQNVQKHIRKNEDTFFHMLFEKKSKVCEPAVNPPEQKPQNDSNITSTVDVNPPYRTPHEPIKVVPREPSKRSDASSLSATLCILTIVLLIPQFWL